MKLHVARDKNNNLYLYEGLPTRDEKTEQFYPDKDYECQFLKLDSNLFPDVKWEDEPQEVVLLKIK